MVVYYESIFCSAFRDGVKEVWKINLSVLGNLLFEIKAPVSVKPSSLISVVAY